MQLDKTQLRKYQMPPRRISYGGIEFKQKSQAAHFAMLDLAIDEGIISDFEFHPYIGANRHKFDSFIFAKGFKLAANFHYKKNKVEAIRRDTSRIYNLWKYDASLRKAVDAVAVFSFHVFPGSDVDDIDSSVNIFTAYDEFKQYVEIDMFSFFTNMVNRKIAYDVYLPSGGLRMIKYNQVIL